MIEATASLRQSFDADQDVLRLLDAVTDAGRQWTGTVARPVLDAPDNSADPVEADTAKASLDQVRSSLEALATRIDQLAADTIENSSSARHVAIAAGVVSLVLYGALIVLSGVLVRAWFVRPVPRLESLVDANSPDLVGAVRGPSEIVAAARVVSDLRHALVVERDSARRQSEGLEQTATLAAQVAVELGGATGEFPAGWTVAASLEPAEGLVAGDSYGVVLASPDVIAVVVIDVAGHGAQPALEALRCKDLLKAACARGSNPARRSAGSTTTTPSPPVSSSPPSSPWSTHAPVSCATPTPVTHRPGPPRRARWSSSLPRGRSSGWSLRHGRPVPSRWTSTVCSSFTPVASPRPATWIARSTARNESPASWPR